MLSLDWTRPSRPLEWVSWSPRLLRAVAGAGTGPPGGAAGPGRMGERGRGALVGRGRRAPKRRPGPRWTVSGGSNGTGCPELDPGGWRPPERELSTARSATVVGRGRLDCHWHRDGQRRVVGLRPPQRLTGRRIAIVAPGVAFSVLRGGPGRAAAPAEHSRPRSPGRRRMGSPGCGQYRLYRRGNSHARSGHRDNRTPGNRAAPACEPFHEPSAADSGARCARELVAPVGLTIRVSELA